MTADQIVAFLQALHAKHIKVSGEWVQASCPLSKWTHKHHADHTPSFGMAIKPGERSGFNCFYCRNGSAEELLQAIELYSKHSPEYNFAVCRSLLNEELAVLPLPVYQEFGTTGDVFEEWPLYWLDSFTSADYVAEACYYLGLREVGLDLIKKYDIRYDSKRKMVVFPYFNVFGKLAGARGRAIVNSGFKHFDYSWQGKNNARLVWFNELALNLPGPAVIVEGQFDLLRVGQVFPKVLANLTAKPTWEKMKKLSDCPYIIQIPDLDEAGEQSTAVYAASCYRLGIGHRVLKLDPSQSMSKIDPADCHPDYLRDKINAFL